MGISQLSFCFPIGILNSSPFISLIVSIWFQTAVLHCGCLPWGTLWREKRNNLYIQSITKRYFNGQMRNLIMILWLITYFDGLVGLRVIVNSSHTQRAFDKPIHYHYFRIKIIKLNEKIHRYPSAIWSIHRNWRQTNKNYLSSRNNSAVKFDETPIIAWYLIVCLFLAAHHLQEVNALLPASLAKLIDNQNCYRMQMPSAVYLIM